MSKFFGTLEYSDKAASVITARIKAVRVMSLGSMSGMSTMSKDWQRITEDSWVLTVYMRVNDSGKWAAAMKEI